MPDDPSQIFARLLHHRGGSLPAGEPVPPPIVPASVYVLPGDPALAANQYGRFGNPTWRALEEALSLLEDAEAVIFPSGMAAIAAVLMSQLRPGDRVLLPSDGYYTTRVLVEKYLAPMGVVAEQCATAGCAGRDLAGYRLVFVETPSNPGLDICDLRRVAAGAEAAGALLVVDNTTMTPLGQRPLDLGADIVVAADTKALNGHSDALLGHVASRDPALVQAVRDWRRLVGAIPGAFDAWLVYRGLETLEVRYERMCRNAGLMAERLAGHRKVLAVRYPGLPDDPGHALARAQMTGFGFLIGLTLPDAGAAERFITGCRCILPATSFGGVRTSAERRARWGDQVAEGYIRLSIGCEPAEALWTELARSLAET